MLELTKLAEAAKIRMVNGHRQCPSDSWPAKTFSWNA
jgi:hypothetical protein